MSPWLLALLLAAVGAPGPAAREPVAAIDACIRQLDPALDVGYARIAQRCPDLAPALAASPWAARLPPDWNTPGNELSAGGLAELRSLLTRDPPAASVRAPRVERIGAVLAALSPHDNAHEGWWTRFKKWLREIFMRQAQTADESLLWRLWRSFAPSGSVLNAIAWGTLALVIALAGAIVMNELRLAGWLSGRHRPTPGSGADTAERTCATLAQVQEASLAQQPRLLLELIVARLHEQERLPPARALTVHELERAARLPGKADRERLAVLATTCEQVRFAAREVPPHRLIAALARGRELLGSLEMPFGEPEGTR